MRERITQYSFTSGQLGSDLNWRSDIQLYQHGAAQLTNMFVMPQGALTKRKGFEYIATVSGGVRCIKFAFSDTQEYVLVFYDSGLEIFHQDTLVATLSSPYTSAQLATLDSCQQYDAMFFTHPDVEPYLLERGSSHTSWTFAAVSFDNIPFDRFNLDQTLTPSATTGSITLTLSGSTSYWTSDHVGVKVKVNDGYAEITSITSGTVANATVTTWLTVSSLSSTSADDAWREEAWSAAHGYPRTVTEHQNRLVFGGTRDLPQSVFASYSGQYLNFDQSDTLDSNSWTKALGTQEVNYIRAMEARQDLYIFSDSDEFVIDGSSPITATAGSVTAQNAVGIANINPVKVNADVVFLMSDGKALQRMRYDNNTLSYQTDSLTLLAQNIINSPVDLGYIANYDDTQSNMIFVVNGDGTMSVLTLDVSSKVAGWSTVTTSGTFKSVCTVDNSLYVLVERSSTVYLEKLTESEIYLDHFYSLTDAGTTSWTGALTLASETCGLVVSEHDTDISTCYVADDVVVGSSGDFTTTQTAQAVAIGYRYTGTIKTLPIAFGVNGQLVRGTRFRKVRAELRVRKTRRFKVDSYWVDDRKIGTMTFDGTLPEIDKIVETGLSGIGTNQDVTITSPDPLPLRLLGITTVVEF